MTQDYSYTAGRPVPASSVEHAPLSPSHVSALYEGFLEPEADSRVMMRWWWFGPHMERADIVHDLDAMVASGIGGVEASFVYPFSPESKDFLSTDFLADVRFAAQEAVARGMRFDITLGSGWPYGGPHIDETMAARRLHWEVEEVPPSGYHLPIPTVWPGDEFIAAYIGAGTAHELPERFDQLEVREGTIVIPPGQGQRVVRIAVSRLARQSVKRAAAGAEGWVLDHLSRAAVEHHIQQVAEPLVAAAGPERLGTVFCDSLEVFGSNYSGMVPEEFLARRGYDPLPHLWKLAYSDASCRAFQSDYYRTLTELVEENFIAVMAAWSESQGLRFRIQGYGQPPVTVSSYRHAHAFEGEGFGWNTITACRWASSAGQIYGKNVISSETWTWTHSPSFRSTPLDILAEAHDHILMGINQFVGHGWPNSPRLEESVGRIFYAAGALDDRNTWWEAAPHLWKTLHRLSWIMRQGRRLAQVGVYVPVRDVYAGFAESGRVDLYKDARLHIGDELPHALRAAGDDFDLFDDEATAHVDPNRFSVVVLPYASDIPETTRAWLERSMAAGVTVIDLGKTAGLGAPAQSVSDVTAALSPLIGLRRLGGSNRTAAVTTREISADLRVHFVANTAAEPIQLELDFRWRGQACNEESVSTSSQHTSLIQRWDPETGAVLTSWGGESAQLDLAPYEAAVLIQARCEDAKDFTAATSVGLRNNEVVLELDQWSVQFPDENILRKVALPHRWENEPDRTHYSGSAVYTSRFTLTAEMLRCFGEDRARMDDATVRGSVVLDLGDAVSHVLSDPEAAGLMEASFHADVVPPVGVVASVTVDGKHCGMVWKTPYRLRLEELGVGEHTLALTVYNVTSHRLAADDRLPQLVAETEASFGRRFGIQTLELALADVSSGLLGFPVIRRG